MRRTFAGTQSRVFQWGEALAAEKKRGIWLAPVEVQDW